MKIWGSILGVGLSCCAPAPEAGPASQLTLAEIQPMLEPLTYRELWGAKCGARILKVKTAFLIDLKASGASADLLAEAEVEAARIEAGERDTPEEYVCTVELAESTEKNATAAQAAWAELKSRKK